MKIDNLKKALGKAVGETTFDLELTQINKDGYKGPSSKFPSLKAPQFRESFLREWVRYVKLHAQVSVPNEVITNLVDILRKELEDFIHPETDKIGTVFPVGESDCCNGEIREDGLKDEQYQSLVRGFACSLVRVAAIIGINETVNLLYGWRQGEPVELKVCTVLSGLHLPEPLSPSSGFQITPLPLSTSELPRLPIRPDMPPRNYLGLSLLEIQLSATPALFCPRKHGSATENVGISSEQYNIETVCWALSLLYNKYISSSFFWYDYKDANAFDLLNNSTCSTWDSGGDNRPRPRAWSKATTKYPTGELSITPAKSIPTLCLDNKKIGRFIELLNSRKKIHIAVDRWYRSIRPKARIESRFIDLRIALEVLYLKDIKAELQYRLALNGAWQLGKSPKDRQEKFTILKKAYDTASTIVHSGTLGKKKKTQEVEVELTRAQNLCRHGLIKVLMEGEPDWTNLVFGRKIASTK